MMHTTQPHDGWRQGARDEVAVRVGWEGPGRAGRFKQIGHEKIQAGVGGETWIPARGRLRHREQVALVTGRAHHVWLS